LLAPKLRFVTDESPLVARAQAGEFCAVP